MKEVNVVILDDEADILSLCVRLFKDQPFGVLATSDPQAVLQAIATQDIKVVLSDNRLPGTSGVEFLRQVKEKAPAVIRILFTGHADIQVAEDAINKGEVYRLLNKPLDLKDLLLLVRDAVEKFDLVRNNQRLAENIQKRNDELEGLSAKLRSMYELQQQFTYTVSHELRTPLAAMKSSIDILEAEMPGKLSDEQKVFIKRLKQGIDRLVRLINSVLDLSRLESGKMVMNLAPFRPVDEVREIVAMNAAVAQSKGLTLEAAFGDAIPVVLADKDRLTQVLSNLVNNALKFTRAGGITVSVAYEDKMNLTFCVRDTGLGVREEDMPKLFKKFEQVGDVNQRVGGTGLGLAICKEIVERHGGWIWAESVFGQGSTFSFTIPARKVKRVLIVDDDPVSRELLSKTLMATDKYEIETASDGFLAGQKCNSFKPQLIILDINMPKVDGFEVCANLKSSADTWGIKIIMHSSFGTEQDEKQVWDAGADEILRKPVNPAEVIAKVERLMSEKSTAKAGN